MMKKNTLVQFIIIYVGIIALYGSITNLLPDLALLFFSLFGREVYNGQYAAGGALIYFIGVLAAFVIIAKSDDISDFVTEKTGLDDSLKIYTKPQRLLSITIVALALSHLLTNVPVLLQDCFFFLTNQTPHRPSGPIDGFSVQNPASPKWLTVILHVLLPCLMIIYCRQLTAYFSKNIMLDEKDMIAEHETVTIDAANNPEDD